MPSLLRYKQMTAERSADPGTFVPVVKVGPAAMQRTAREKRAAFRMSAAKHNIKGMKIIIHIVLQ